MEIQNHIIEVTAQLKKEKRNPSSVEVSNIGKAHVTTLRGDKKLASTLDINATAGIGRSLSEATNKAFSEWIERLVVKDQQYEDSTGVAAFPISNNGVRYAKLIARAEALERYLWAKWWENKEYGATINKLTLGEIPDKFSVLFSCKKDLALKDIILVKPYYADPEGVSPLYLYGIFNNNGAVAGASSGWSGDFDSSVLGAAFELYRHGLAYLRSKNNTIGPPDNPATIYEQKILHFGNNGGGEILNDRLNIRGKKEVPPLSAESIKVSSQYDMLYSIYACKINENKGFLKTAQSGFYY